MNTWSAPKLKEILTGKTWYLHKIDVSCAVDGKDEGDIETTVLHVNCALLSDVNGESKVVSLRNLFRNYEPENSRLFNIDESDYTWEVKINDKQRTTTCDTTGDCCATCRGAGHAPKECKN